MAEAHYTLTPDRLSYEIDWSVPREEFIKNLQEMISLSIANHKVLVIPFMEMTAGDREHRAGTMALISAAGAMGCKDCDARCCRHNPDGKPTNLVGRKEISRISRLLPAGSPMLRIRHKDGMEEAELPFPCVFLQDGRCSIYDDRPIVCKMFPLQFNDAGNFALSSDCPSSVQLAEKIYMTYYDLGRSWRDL